MSRLRPVAVLLAMAISAAAALTGCSPGAAPADEGATSMATPDPTLTRQSATDHIVADLQRVLSGLPDGYRIAAASPVPGLEPLGQQNFPPCQEGSAEADPPVTTSITYWVWLPAGTSALDGLTQVVQRFDALGWDTARPPGVQPAIQFGSASTDDGYGFSLVTNARGMLSVRAGSPCFLTDVNDATQLAPAEITRQ